MDKQNDYDTYEDKGFQAKPLPRYKKIRVYFLFDVKHYGRYKARIVAYRNLTEVPL